MLWKKRILALFPAIVFVLHVLRSYSNAAVISLVKEVYAFRRKNLESLNLGVASKYLNESVRQLMDIRLSSSRKINVVSMRVNLSSPFTCANLSYVQDVTSMCAGTVDYSFYLPTAYTLDDLNDLAIRNVAMVNKYANTQCLSNIKRFVCAAVYLKCRGDNFS